MGLSIDDLKIDHNSRPRNPIIANACFLSGYIDSWGRGTLKIINSCKEYGLPEPTIIEKNGGIEVTMLSTPRIGSEGLVKGLVKELVKELSENQIKLLELIESRPKVTKEDMAKYIGISTTAIDKNIKTLREKGILERVGGRKEGYWKILTIE
jgi:ATP-dependent DNA helicase RecG